MRQSLTVRRHQSMKWEVNTYPSSVYYANKNAIEIAKKTLLARPERGEMGEACARQGDSVGPRGGPVQPPPLRGGVRYMYAKRLCFLGGRRRGIGGN